jgi:hypothetical protein
LVLRHQLRLWAKQGVLTAHAGHIFSANKEFFADFFPLSFHY